MLPIDGLFFASFNSIMEIGVVKMFMKQRDALVTIARPTFTYHFI